MERTRGSTCGFELSGGKENLVEEARGEPEKLDENEEAVVPPVDLGPEEEAASSLVPFDPLRRYLAEIRRYPLLTREEERELAIRYKEHGDVRAAFQLVTANLRLVVMIAREYQRAFWNILDLVQEGNVGLMEAVKKFDPYRGTRFPSYAAWWIRAYIIRYIMNNWRMVKIGTTQAQRKLFFNLRKEKERLEAHGFVPATKLLAHRLDVKEDEVIEMEQRLAARDVSVDTPIEGGEATLLDFLPDEQFEAEARVADKQYRARVHEKIAEFGRRLKDKDKMIFDNRLLAEQPMTLQEIGDCYGISRERVRQIEERLKRRLKKYLVEEFKDLKELDVSFI